MTNLFKEGQTSGATQLQRTAELTSVANATAKEICKAIEASTDELKPLVLESQTDNNAMDKLINQLFDLSTIDIEFLKSETPEDLDKMLKSQQSKRSRTKSKAMTYDNYVTMLTGAVAENLLRLASGKSKSAGGGGKTIDVVYDEEALEALKNDQEKLRKEIRNIQSKKSIMKSKANFKETDERWLKLLDAEVALKSIRTTVIAKPDERVDKISELMGSVENIDSLKSADAKELLKQILSSL